jgi:hypothetical protein
MAMSAHARVALAAPAARCVSTPSRAAAAPARAFAARAPVRARAARKTHRLAAARAFAPRDVPEASVEPPLVEPSVVAEPDARSPSVAFLSVSLAVLANAAYDTAAFAAEGYQGIGVPDDEATPLQNAFGAVFTVFCGWYFLRVVKKRGNRAKEFRVANTLPVRGENTSRPPPRTNPPRGRARRIVVLSISSSRATATRERLPENEKQTSDPRARRPVVLDAQKEEREARDAEQLAKAKKLTPMQAFTGGVTGLAIAFVLYGFTQTIVGTFDGKPVPESYQARQITITVRTIVSGLAYLATFVYAANGTGLVALAAQKWLDKLTGVDLIDEQAAKWEEEKKAQQEREEQ